MNKLCLRQALLFIAVCLLSSVSVDAQTCPDRPPQTTGSHSFRRQGESFEIPLNLADCQPVVLELRWSNGRNNGSNFHVTFLDSENLAIYSKEVSGFMSGSFQFPFATLEPQPWLGSRSLIAVPVRVTVEAVPPFALPASISYRVTHVSLHPVGVEKREPEMSSGGKSEKPKAELVESADGKTGKPSD